MADDLSERDKMFSMTELKGPAVSKPETDQGTATPARTTCGQLMEFLDIIPGKLQHTKKDTSIFGRYHSLQQ